MYLTLHNDDARCSTSVEKHNLCGVYTNEFKDFPLVGFDLLLVTFRTAKIGRNTRIDRRVHPGIQTRDPNVTAGL
jgi:hypothetical protein